MLLVNEFFSKNEVAYLDGQGKIAYGFLNIHPSTSFAGSPPGQKHAGASFKGRIYSG